MAVEIATDRVAGFYTLSSTQVALQDVPAEMARRLPRYPSVPAARLGWLGRDTRFKGLGLGEALLFDAIRTLATAPIGAHAIFADAIDQQTAAFYAAFGFLPLTDQPPTLYLPMATALKVIRGEAG